MKKDAKGGVCKQCGTCGHIGWLFPVIILAIVWISNWLTSTWGKWVLTLIAVLYLIKRFKGCKKCCEMK